MKSKAPLMLMEQMIMLLVFALAAALCMQAFVKSDSLSKGSEARDSAVLAVQSAAEALRYSQGDFAQAAEILETEQYDQDSLQVDYTEDWTPAEDTMRYTLGAGRADSGQPGLGKATVWVRDEAADTELFRIEVAWQEVSQDGSE